MKKRTFVFGLVTVPCLVFCLIASGQTPYVTSYARTKTAPTGKVLTGGLTLQAGAFAKQGLENSLDNDARDLTVAMQRLEGLRRNNLQFKINNLAAQHPVSSPAPSKGTGFLDRIGIKTFFTGIFAPKPKKESPRVGNLAIPSTPPLDLTKLPSLPDIEKARLERESVRLTSELRRLVDQAMGYIPDDVRIRSGAASLEPSDVALLGSVLNAVTVLRMADMGEALGFKSLKAEAQCTNVVLAEDVGDNSYETSYLSRFFQPVSQKFTGSADQEKNKIAEAQYAMAKIQQGLNCLSLKDISVLDFQSARAMIYLNLGLWASGKGYAAKALVENYLPAGLLIWNAAKTFKIPETFRLFYLDSDYSSLRRDGFAFSFLQLADREDGSLDIKINDTVVATLPRLDPDSASALAMRYGTGGEGAPLIRSLLAIAADPRADRTTFRWLGGLLMPYPWAREINPATHEMVGDGMPLVAVDFRGQPLSNVFQRLLDFSALGEGTCSLHEMADNNLQCQSQTTCNILQGRGMRSSGEAPAGGAIGAFFAGLSGQPGGSQSDVTHFGVRRSGIGDFCSHSGGAGGGPMPSAGSSLSCVMPTGFSGMINPQMNNLMQCAVKVTKEGQARTFQAFTSLGQQGGFGCHINPVMEDGHDPRPSVWAREASQARSYLRERYGEDGRQAYDDAGHTIAGGIADILNGDHEGMFSEEDGANLYTMGLDAAQQMYADGTLPTPPGGETAAETIHREAVNIAIAYGRVEADRRAAGGSSSSGGATAGTPPPSEKPPAPETPPEKKPDSANGSQQCSPEEAGSCNGSCGLADEMIRSFSDCLDGGSDHPVDRCRVTPDGCGDTRGGGAPSSVIDPLAGCLANPPDVSSYAGCINVYCADSDPNCCGSSAAASGGGALTGAGTHLGGGSSEIPGWNPDGGDLPTLPLAPGGGFGGTTTGGSGPQEVH